MTTLNRDAYERFKARARREMEERRRRSADMDAARRVVGNPDEDEQGETDPAGFWDTVGTLAGEAWDEAGSAIKHGAAGALDEVSNLVAEWAGEERDPEYLRKRWETSAPESAGGNMLAGAAQWATGTAVSLLPAGRVVAGGKMAFRGAQAAYRWATGAKATAPAAGAAAGAGAATGAAGGTAAGGGMAATAGKAALEATVGRFATASAMSDYAAFSAEEQRMFVAMNEVPAFADFIPDWLAADDPDDPEWMQRAERALEGQLVGAALEMAVRTAAHFVRASKKGLAHKAIDAPNKEAVQEALRDQAVREVDAAANELYTPTGQRTADELAEAEAGASRTLSGLEAERTKLQFQVDQPITDRQREQVTARLAEIEAEMPVAQKAVADAKAANEALATIDDAPIRSMNDVAAHFASPEAAQQFRQGVAQALTAELKAPPKTVTPQGIGRALRRRRPDALDTQIADLQRQVDETLAADGDTTALQRQLTELEGQRVAREEAEQVELVGLRRQLYDTMAAGGDTKQIRSRITAIEAEQAGRDLPATGVPEDLEAADIADAPDMTPEDLVPRYDAEEDLIPGEMERVQEAWQAQFVREGMSADASAIAAQNVMEKIRFMDRELADSPDMIEELFEGNKLKKNWRETFTANLARPGMAVTGAHPLGLEIPPDLTSFVNPKVLEEQMALASVSARESGMIRFGEAADTDAYVRQESRAWSRLREWQAAPGNPARRMAALQTMSDYYNAYGIQAGKGTIPDMGALDAARARPDDLREYVLAQTRDFGRRSPQTEAAMIEETVAQASGRMVTRRSEGVASVRAGEPEDFGSAPNDEHLARQRPEALPGLSLPGAYRRGLPHYDDAAEIDRPADVWFDAIRGVEDYGTTILQATEDSPVSAGAERIAAAVSAGEKAQMLEGATRVLRERSRKEAEKAWTASREADAAAGYTGRVDEAALRTSLRAFFEPKKGVLFQSLDDHVEQQATRALEEMAKEGAKPGDVARTVTGSRKAYGVRQALGGFGELTEEGMNRLQVLRTTARRQTAQANADRTAWQAAREARAIAATEVDSVRAGEARDIELATEDLEALVRDSLDPAFSFRGKMPQGTDARHALETLHHMLGTVQRMGIAAGDMVSDAAAGAAFARAMNKLEGFTAWLGGDTRGARDALRRSALEVETGEALESATRRLRDHRLIAKSGGIQAVRETAKGMSNVKNISDVLAAQKRWKAQSRYAWSLGQRFGSHQMVPTMLRILYANYLSGPATHAVNLISGLGMATLRVGEDAMAGAFFGEFAGSAAENSPKAAAAKRMASTLRAGGAGIWDGMRLFAYHIGMEATNRRGVRDAVMSRIRQADLEHVYNAAIRNDHFEESIKNVRMGAPELLKDSIKNETLRSWVDGTADAFGMTAGGGWVTSLMQGGDVFVKAISSRMQLQHDAVTGALRKGLRGEAYAKHVDSYLRNPTEEAMNRAKVAGELNTFTEDPGRWTQTALQFGHRYPSVRLIAPFIRTPGNAMRQGLERLPLSDKIPLLKTFVEGHDRLSTKGSPEDIAKVRARQASGAAIMVGSYWLVDGGYITGGSPQNKKLAGMRRKLGINDYAAKIGDKYVDYHQILGRYAAPLAIMADTWELVQAADTEREVSMAGVIASTAANVIGFTLDETALRNLVDLGDAMTHPDPEQAVLQVARIAARTGAAATMPGHGALGGVIDRMGNDGVTSDYTISRGAGGADEPFIEALWEQTLLAVNQAKDQIWWLGTESDKLPRRGWDGEPLVNGYPMGIDGEGRKSILMAAFSQSKLSEEDTRPEAQVMLEVGFAIPRPAREIAIREEGQSLPKERILEYTRAEYDQLAKMQGQDFKRRLTKLMNRAKFRNDLADYRAGRHEFGAALRDQISNEWYAALDKARDEVRRRSVEFRTREFEATTQMTLERRQEEAGLLPQ